VLCPVCQRAQLVQLHGYIACPQDRFQLDVRSESITLEHVRQRLAEAYQVGAPPPLLAVAAGWLRQAAACCQGAAADAPRARRCLAGAPALRLQQVAAVLAQAAVGQRLAVRQLQQLRHAQRRHLSVGGGSFGAPGIQHIDVGRCKACVCTSVGAGHCQR
jgi:hypothetical protein